MAAIDIGAVRQVAELAQRVPELGRRALEHPTAAEREQGVAGEQGVAVGEIERDVTGGMAGGLVHLRGVAGEVIGIALGDGDVHIGDPGGLGLGTDQRGAVLRLQRLVAVDMVGVVVGVEDMGQRPAALGQGRLDRRRLARIHHGGRAR